jgi:DNA-binding NarL/FixJ family response regulator
MSRSQTHAADNSVDPHLAAEASAPGVDLVSMAFARQYQLSAREQQVSVLNALGFMEKQIADRLQLNPKTVAIYLQRCCLKTRCTDRRTLRRMLFEFAAAAWEGLPSQGCPPGG